jgi:hypothetical protein
MTRASSAPRFTIRKPITPETKLTVGISQGTRSTARAMRVNLREGSRSLGGVATSLGVSILRSVAELGANVKL